MPIPGLVVTLLTTGGGTETLVSRSAGSTIGDMTGGGGLAAAFDDTTNQSFTASARKIVNNTISYCGKDWGVGVTRTASKAEVWSTNDNGFHDTTGQNTTLTLQGSTDNFSSSTVDLGSTNIPSDAANTMYTVTATDTSTAYRYHRIKVSAVSGQQNNLAEIRFYELV